MPEIKVEYKDTPKSLRDKVVDVINEVLTNLCGTVLFETCEVESVKLPAFTERRICDNKTDEIWFRCLTIEESDHIHVKMLDYLTKAGEATTTPQTDMDIVKIFTNDKNNPNVWGKLIDPAGYCSFSVATRMAVSAIMSALLYANELDITWTFWDYPEPKLAPTKDCWTFSNSKPEPDVALDKPLSTPKLLKDKIINTVHNALALLCDSDDTFRESKVKASELAGNTIIKISDNKSGMAWSAFKIFENEDRISITVSDSALKRSAKSCK